MAARYGTEGREVKVGDGATICYYTDRKAATVIAKTAKTITVQEDTATRVDKNGMSDSQAYSYAANPNGSSLMKTLK